MLTRRRLLKTMIVTAGSVSAASLLAACHDHADAGASIDAATVFPQSVASGDPRPDSIVLWTRVDVEGAASGAKDQDARIGIEVSRDASFSSLIIGEYFTAPATHDHCLKVRVVGLEPGTFYYYRFLHGRAISKTGRTRTAPAENADTEVKFAFLSCQDYIGRYYNAYLMLLEQDPDFIVFLGDYIYETTGDAEFQNTGSERNITFDDSSGALKIGPADNFYYAAASLDNYRQLYRVYRQDPLLQQVHELYPFINTWDDHEYSDDCWGDSSTYYDGATNETDLVRRRNAEQAFFEFTPIDQFSVADELAQQKEALSVSDTPLYPDARIFRDFRFGRHMQLFMTDFRSYRPDHLVPEDAFPGSMVYDQAQLETYYTSVGTDFADVASLYSPYLNIDAAEHADRKSALESGLRTAYQTAFTAKGLDLVEHADRIEQLVMVGSTGNIIASQLNNYLSDALKLGDGEISSLPKGLGFSTMGKTTLFSDVGARYFVIKPVFDVFATLKTIELGTPSVYGDAQTEWLTTGLRASTATWKLVGSSVSFSPLILDLAAPPLPYIDALFPYVPANFRQAFYFDVDDWDGFPVQKQALLRGVLGETGAITIAGDVHSSYVCEHPAAENGKRSFDFTGGAISSGTWGEFTESAAQTVSPALVALVPRLDEALVEASSRDLAASQVKFASTSEHAVSIMRVNASGATVDFHLVPSIEGTGENKVSVVGTRYYDNAAAYLAKRRKVTFAVVDGQLQGPT